MIVDGGAFDPATWGEQVIVVCDDRAAATRALVRAAERMVRVGSDGVERGTGDELEERLRQGAIDAEACEYVSEPTLCERGPQVYLDTRSEISDEIGEAFLRIIREELLAEGIEHARIEAPGPFDYYSVGEGIFLPEADALEFSPIPSVLGLVGVLESRMPGGSVMMLNGLAAFAAEHASSDATPVRKAMPGRIELDGPTMRAFWQIAERAEELAQPVEDFEPSSLNIIMLDAFLSGEVEQTQESFNAFWEEVWMLVAWSDQVEAAQPTLDLMEAVSDGRVQLDREVLQALRDGAVRVIKAGVLAERTAHAVAMEQVGGLLVYRGDEVLVHAPEIAAFDRFRANRSLPEVTLRALAAATRGARLVDVPVPAMASSGALRLQLFDGEKAVGEGVSSADGADGVPLDIPFGLLEHLASDRPRPGVRVRIEAESAVSWWPER